MSVGVVAFVYYRERYYSPATGRFISEDPIGWASGQTNAYAYGGGNPVQFTDPAGLQAIPIVPPPLPVGPNCNPGSGGVPKWFNDLFDGSTFNRPKNPPDEGPANGWIEGPRRGREYGSDGLPQRDYDKPHQGNEVDHVHEWPGGTRGTGASLLAVAPKTMTDGSASMIDFSGFVEAHVTGITFTEDDKGVSIFFRGQARQCFTLVAEGVDRFVADKFREQNIVDRIHLWDSASEPNDYRDSLALLLSGVSSDQRNETVWLPVIEREVVAIERGEKVFVEIEPVYGGWIVLLAKSIAINR